MPKFQSLIGFKINWNSTFDDVVLATFRFQSLIGFKINWNNLKFKCPLLAGLVSIPNRV